MKITFTSTATLVSDETDEIVENQDLYKALDGYTYEENGFTQYMDSELPESGLKGATVLVEYRSEGTLNVHTIYRAPRELTEQEIKSLLRETSGQWSDGLGENGIPVTIKEQEFKLYVGLNETGFSVSQIDDGRPVSGPPLVFINALDENLPELQKLLEAGGEPNEESQGMSALSRAVANGHTAMTHLLLEHGANPNCIDSEGYTLLHTCAHSDSVSDEKSVEFSKLLIDLGVPVNSKNEFNDSALELAEIMKKDC